jgi:hypothetical protein
MVRRVHLAPLAPRGQEDLLARAARWGLEDRAAQVVPAVQAAPRVPAVHSGLLGREARSVLVVHLAQQVPAVRLGLRVQVGRVRSVDFFRSKHRSECHPGGNCGGDRRILNRFAQRREQVKNRTL